jgi:outer membrane protein assembly factor BamB
MVASRRRSARRVAFVALVVLPTAMALLASPTAWGATAAASRPYAGAAPRPSGQWPMFMYGPMRRGRTTIVGAQSPTVAWRISAETNYGGPVIGRDGTIYQGTFAGQLLALNPDGTTKWVVTVPYIVETTPAILLDGRIAFVAGGGLYVVNPDGSPSWRFHTGGAFNEAAPAIGSDGTIYTAGNQVLYALHPDGSLRWSYDAGHGITGPPAIAADGTVYFPAPYLFALDPNGSLLWRSDIPALGGSPSLGSTGTIYVNSTNIPTVYAFNPDGTLAWSYSVGSCCSQDVPSSPAIGLDGTVYVGETALGGAVVLALYPNGTLKWQVSIGAYHTGMSIGGDGTIYFGATTYGYFKNVASVFALNRDGTLKWEYDDPGGGYVRTPPAIGSGQRIYAGSISGFFAIGP